LHCYQPSIANETHLLDDLLLLNQESTDDTVLDAVGTARATVGTLDGLGGLGDSGILAGAQGGDLLDMLGQQQAKRKCPVGERSRQDGREAHGRAQLQLPDPLFHPTRFYDHDLSPSLSPELLPPQLMDCG
jgi:hypothetical protein